MALTPKNRFYVYFLRDPRDGEVFYVGKGCGRRMYSHAVEAKRVTGFVNAEKVERIRSVWRDGFDIAYEVFASGLSEQEAFRIEAEQIHAFKNLTNGCSGLTGPEKARALLQTLAPFARWRPPSDTLAWLSKQPGGAFGFYQRFKDGLAAHAGRPSKLDA